MKKLLFLCICMRYFTVEAHQDSQEGHTAEKAWYIAAQHTSIQASFLLCKNDTVYLETAQHKRLKYPLADLGQEEQLWVWQKRQQIKQLQHYMLPSTPKLGFWESNKNLCMWFLLLLSVFAIAKLPPIHTEVRIGFYLLGVVSVGIFASFKPQNLSPLATDPHFIDSAFVPFKPKVRTRWDAQYFYVESLGLPNHQMMKGIRSWQQQVPIPQCYVGTNAWSIPLNPVIAATPTPTATHFFKGAIAIAANGIPIFNALNNRGEDAYAIGELDDYGGHCGRADDYHYHIAPMTLDSINADILPIAFALDGFAVYAHKEPNGQAMYGLDSNHGHYYNGVYHYHGTSSYPYMIGNMVGVVTQDATDQIIPQAQARAIRPACTPLTGAAISNHQANGANAYSLTYTLNNQNYFVNYSWTNNGVYTFNFVSPTGTTTSNYTGQICSLSTVLRDYFGDLNLKIYPNPTPSGLQIELPSPIPYQEVQWIQILDVQGRIVRMEQGFKNFISTEQLLSGVYWLRIQFSNQQLNKQFRVQK